MKKITGPGAILLAGLLVIPGHLWLASQVQAQSQTPTLTDKQYQELQQKRQEEWEYYDQKEKKQHPSLRRPEALKRQEDAIKRQKAAEKRLRELEKQGK
ncbi:MAG: hypothetical protein AB1424_03680 [Thermodesulfobacteriota bacterium]